ncbi:MAG TPA: cupin domain-containing protein [Ilumatobacteraceae bacterium]|nr:cupin domain-containing protein [Ilumatobacteraceae bacterium]
MTTPGERFGVALPGGTSVSHVQAYDSVGPDGLAGGSPHLHTVCTEAYLVIAGEGMVQTLSGEGYAETPLVHGTIAWFSPGTVHRLVNLDGRLELYVLMSNAGLPEAGDMVLAFAPEVLADEARYRSRADLPADGRTTDDPSDASVRRRDLAVDGFSHWRSAVDTAGPSALSGLYTAAVALVGERPETWGALVDADPAGDLERSRLQIGELCAADRSPAASRLEKSAVRSRSLLPATRAMGCCGTLGTIVN